MTKTLKKIIIVIASIIGIGVIAYLGFVLFVVYTFTRGCGMDDGPFYAVKTAPIEISESATRFPLSGNGELILDNRNDTLSPILTLKENGEIKWTLDTDVRNTKGYETCRIWEIGSLTITKDTDPIRLIFTGHWTYGVEAGSMKIKRKSGENSFCLSW
jgi:hypothetical protein